MSIQQSELFKTESSSRWLANQAASSANMIEKMIREELRRGDFSNMAERVRRIEELVNEHLLESSRERELLLLAAILLEGGGETRTAYRFVGRLLAEEQRFDQAFLSRLQRFRIRLALNRGDLLEAAAEVSLIERVVIQTSRGLGEVNETVDQEDVSRVTVATWLLSAEVSLAEKKLDQARQDLANARSCMGAVAPNVDESVMFELLSALVCVNLDDAGGAPAVAYLYQNHVNQRSQSQVQALTSARIAAAAGDMRRVNGISESEALRWRNYGPDRDVVEHYLREGAPSGISEAFLEKLPSPHELIAALDENLVELRRNDGERQVRPDGNVDLVPLSFLFEYFPLEEITGMFDYNSKTGQLEVDWRSCDEAIVREAIEVGAVSDVALRCKGGTIYLNNGSYVDASFDSSEADLRSMSAVDVIFELFRISSARLPGAGVRQFQGGAEGTQISEVINLRPNKLNLDLARRLDHLRSGKSDEDVADDELDLDSAFAGWGTPGQFSRVASAIGAEAQDTERDVTVSIGDLSCLGGIVSSRDVVSLELSVVECLAAAGVGDSRIEILMTESGERLRECGLNAALCDVWGTYEVGMCTVVLALRKGVRVLNAASVDVIMRVAVQRLRTLPASHLAVKVNAPGFIAEDPRSQRMLSQLRDIAGLDGVENPQKITHVLLSGERGVGKELIAKLIHDWSGRSGERYQVINLGALARELAVGELFGSKKGSFTGSVADRIGYIQKADNGTLFVDELDEGSDSMQALLKRVVQFGTYNVVGSPDERLCNVRFIAASNRVSSIKADLKDRFWIVEVPALRERPADIAPLAQYFASQHEYSLPEPVLSYLTGLQWPGNVRQLETVVHRVCAIVKTADEVNLASFENAVRDSGNNPGVCDTGTDQFAPLAVGETLKDRLNAQEQLLIENALKFTKWNKTATARLLGLSRPNLRERMRVLGMAMEKPDDSRSDKH